MQAVIVLTGGLFEVHINVMGDVQECHYICEESTLNEIAKEVIRGAKEIFGYIQLSFLDIGLLEVIRNIPEICDECIIP